MPNITPRKNKSGQIISYRIRVARGYDSEGNKIKPYEKTYKPAPGMTEKQIKKELQKVATLFEEQCKQGYSLDNKQTFEQYAKYVLQCKEQAGTKRRTIESYRSLLTHINAGIGHIKLSELRPQHLTAFYNQLRQSRIREKNDIAVPVTDVRAIMEQMKINRRELSNLSGVSPTTITSFCKGNNISLQNAVKIAHSLSIDEKNLFTVKTDKRPLSEKTILEHHRLISSILSQAEKEMLIPYNSAEKIVNKPKQNTSHEVNYFQSEQLEQIRNALKTEPLKWQVMTHLLLVTGCRRGEVMGLKWSAVDLENGSLKIENNLLYSKELGVYEDTTKTDTSTRIIRIPAETVQLLKEYKAEWESMRRILGTSWNHFLQMPNGKGEIKNQYAEYLFVREDKNKIGYPISPDSLTKWLDRFYKRHGLPHINPHAFRHTLASVLCMQNVDMTTISKWLGHKNVTTTLNIYEHILEQGKEQVVNCVSDVILKKRA